MAKREKINSEFFGHIDYIERDDVLNTVCKKISGLRFGDTEKICIYGEWGCGKSYTLELIKERLQKEDDCGQKYVIVHYDAWRNIFYDDPLIAMMYSLIDVLKSDYKKKYNKAMRPYRGRGTRQKIDMALERLGDVSDERRLAKVVGILYKLVKHVILCRGADITENQRLADFESYSNLLTYFTDAMNAITTGETPCKEGGHVSEKRKNAAKSSCKLIILMDEIDRCTPDKQLKVLECTHNLFELKNCVIVYALNLDVVKKFYGHNFGDTGDERFYFEKFFDHTYKLPLKTSLYFGKYFYNVVMSKYGEDTKGPKTYSDDVKKRKYIWRFVSAKIAQKALANDDPKVKITNADIDKGFNNRQASKFLIDIERLMADVFVGYSEDEDIGDKIHFENKFYYIYAYLFCYLYVLKSYDRIMYEHIRDGDFKDYTDFVNILRNEIKTSDVSEYKDLFNPNSSISTTRNFYQSQPTNPPAVIDYRDPDFNTINYVLNARSDKAKAGSKAKEFAKKIQDAGDIVEVVDLVFKKLDSEVESPLQN